MAKQQESVLAKIEKQEQKQFDMQLPDFFNTTPVEVVQRINLPFVHIAQPKSTNFWNKLVAKFGATVQEGNAYLFLPKTDDIINLEPLKFGLLLAKQYWLRTAQNGDILEVTDKKHHKWGERIVSSIIVYMPDGTIVPAPCEWRRTKCTAIHQMVKNLELAGNPVEWAKKGREYEHTLVAKKPFMRFYGTKICKAGTVKTEDGGNNYVFATADIKPTTTVEWESIGKFMSDPESVNRLNEVGEQFKQDCARLDSKISK